MTVHEHAKTDDLPGDRSARLFQGWRCDKAPKESHTQKRDDSICFSNEKCAQTQGSDYNDKET
jgi:hypothetical protein